MFQVSIFNNSIENIIHAPISDKSLPHLLEIKLKESLSLPEELSFTIPINNSGYNLITGIKTKVKVVDTKGNKVIFVGRVIPSKDGMSSDGNFHKDVTCEGALAYLNDTHTRRWNFTNKTPAEILTFILNQHNSKVDDSRKISLGTIEVTQPITIDTNYETSLNAIVSKIKNVLGGDIRVQERGGILYLDYLRAQGANNNVEIKIGYNLKEAIREMDPTDIVNRVIPMGYGEGVNQLDITKVNNGTEYVQDNSSISQYGLIEGLATNKDLQNADTLKIWGQNVLNEKKQPIFSYSMQALDLSVLTGHEGEKYDLGDTIHTIVDVIGIDVYARVIERERDLLKEPWNPKLTISTRPITLTDQIVDLKQRNLSLENAPQGNTVIFPISKAENADAIHPIEIDIDIPKETININRVYLNIHGRKYRADSKSITGGASSTSTSGPSSAASSGSSREWGPGWGSDIDTGQDVYNAPVRTHLGSSFAVIFRSAFNHTHNIPHTHNMAHTHENTIDYGIYESTFPKNVRVRVNGQDIGLNIAGNASFDQYDIDITRYVQIGNNKIIISTEQNGRIDAIVYSQIFIQSK